VRHRLSGDDTTLEAGRRFWVEVVKMHWQRWGASMSIKQFELFHGAVLTKLLRNGKPASLCLVERTERDPWAAYCVNDACSIYIKYRTTCRADADVQTPIFDFQFTKPEISAIRELQKDLSVYFALVCASDRIASKGMEICFIEPAEFMRLTNNGALNSVSISVWYEDGKGLRVKSKTLEKPIVVPRSRLDSWEAPGS
jgi:hypothetical protein